MSFLSRFFGRKKSTSKPKETVLFDDEKITRTMRDGNQETLLWSDLEEVAIITTDEGPFVDDVFWVLSGKASGCLAPSEAVGVGELIVRLQKLPGFKNEVVIEAMGSTTNAKFVCWTKADKIT
jgi:hypothetical protein